MYATVCGGKNGNWHNYKKASRAKKVKRDAASKKNAIIAANNLRA